MPQERRLSIRKPLDHIAYLSLPPNNGGFVVDVSEGGLGFQSIAPVEANAPIHFRFAIDSAERIKAVGELAWKDGTGKVGGLRFTDLPDEVREHIRVWTGQSPAKAQVVVEPQEQAEGEEVQQRAEAQEITQETMRETTLEVNQEIALEGSADALPAEAQAPMDPIALDAAVPQPSPSMEAAVGTGAHPDLVPSPLARNPLLYNLKPPIYSGPSYGLSMFPVEGADCESEVAAVVLPQSAAIKHPIAAVGLTIALAFVASLGIFGYVCSSKTGDLLYDWGAKLWGESYSQSVSQDPTGPANPGAGSSNAPQR